MKPDAIFELGVPVMVPFMGRIVIQNDVDFFVPRLLGYDPVQKAEKVFPFLVVGELGAHLTGADFQRGK